MRDKLMRLGRKLRHAMEARAVILVYHRVADLAGDPFSLAVSPTHFAEHLRVLCERYVPIPLRELVTATRRGDIPHRGVAITFDDGYADNLYAARPLLETASVPATVFVVAGKVGSREEFWWDRLERLVHGSGRPPRRFTLEIAGQSRDWETGAGDSSREGLYREMWSTLRPLADEERESAMRSLEAQIGEPLPARSGYLPMTAEELTELCRGGLVEIGAHGLTHARLADLSPADQRREIEEAKSRLARLVGSPVTSFAYPYGTPGDYSLETARIVAEAGFDCACANVSAWVVAGVDRFQLPRLRVYDWGGQEFGRRLRRFLWA